MATKLGLYNGALRLLKQRKLAAVSDAHTSRYLLDDVYDDTIAECLEAGYWNFATRTAEIAASEDIDPDFAYAYAFEHPDDFVRLITMAANEFLRPPLQDFIDEANIWYCDTTPIYVSYVSNGASYGLDLASWPMSFQRAVEYALALQIAPHLTNMSAAERKVLREEAADALRTARTKDASNQARMQPAPGSLVRARLGRRMDMRRR